MALTYIFGFILSFLGCLLVIKNPKLAQRTQGRLEDTNAAQAMHSAPTPRIGGVIVVTIFSFGLIFGRPEALNSDLIFALVAGVIVFAAGAIEDITRNVSARARLIAAFISAAVAVFLSSTMLRGFGLAELDFIFTLPVVALVLTLIWSAGFCHALNLIDGLNGLSSSYSMIAALGFAAVAHAVGSADIAFAALLLFSTLAGFFVLNWPAGTIFLGDAGAYAIGHILAWFSILLIARHEEISAFAMLLILFWPIADTAFTIIRRKMNRHPADVPDRLHFHHLVARALRLRFGRRKSRGAFNAVSTLVLIPLFTSPVVLGVVLWDRPLGALFALLVFTLLFMGAYIFGKDFVLNRRFQD